MLFWMDNGEQVYEIGKTRQSFFEIAKSRLSPDEFDSIVKYIDEIIDKIVNEGGRSFVPGQSISADWSGTPLQVVYDKACNMDSDLSALWVGLIAMQVVIDRPEMWYATKTEFKGRDFEQMIYFISGN